MIIINILEYFHEISSTHTILFSNFDKSFTIDIILSCKHFARNSFLKSPFIFIKKYANYCGNSGNSNERFIKSDVIYYEISTIHY